MKILYKLLTLAASVVIGLVAGALSKRIWKFAAGEGEAPKGTQRGRRAQPVAQQTSGEAQ